MTHDTTQPNSTDALSRTRPAAIAPRQGWRRMQTHLLLLATISALSAPAFAAADSGSSRVAAAPPSTEEQGAPTATGLGTPSRPPNPPLDPLSVKFSDFHLPGVSTIHLQASGNSPRTTPNPDSASNPAGAPTSPRPADGLAEAPLDAEGLGFRMRVPVGTAVRVEKNPTNYLLSDASDAPAWRIRAAALSASKAETTAASQCDDYIALMKTKGAGLEVLVNEPRRIGGRDAHLVYIAMPLDGGGRGITGNLVIPDGPDAYLVFATLVVDGEFERVRALLDRAFATLELKDTSAESMEKLGLLARGTEVILGFSEERLRSTIAPDPVCYRMWRPDGEGGEKDFGYALVRVREGKRGEVDASREPKNFKGDENDAGLFVTLDARVVINDDPTHTLDAQSRYFVTWDRSSESWSVRTTERHKRASRSSAQTGVRLAPSAGEPRPRIEVISSGRETKSREPQSWPVPPSYISQAELVVLGQLLPDPGEATIEFADYAFDQRDEKLPQRRESWSRTVDGFRLETRPAGAPAKLVQEFDAKGRRIRRTDIDGTVTERIDLEDLRALWKSKGLPVN